MSIKFDITGDGEFAEAMEKAMKQFPASNRKSFEKRSKKYRKRSWSKSTGRSKRTSYSSDRE